MQGNTWVKTCLRYHYCKNENDTCHFIWIYRCIYIYICVRMYIYIYTVNIHVCICWLSDDVCTKIQKCRKKTLHTSPWMSSNHLPKIRETWQLSIPISSPPANFFRSLRQARSARRPSEAKASENPRFYRGMDGNPYEILTKSSKSSWNMDEMNVFLNNYPKQKLRQNEEVWPKGNGEDEHEVIWCNMM